MKSGRLPSLSIPITLSVLSTIFLHVSFLGADNFSQCLPISDLIVSASLPSFTARSIWRTMLKHSKWQTRSFMNFMNPVFATVGSSHAAIAANSASMNPNDAGYSKSCVCQRFSISRPINTPSVHFFANRITPYAKKHF